MVATLWVVGLLFGCLLGLGLAKIFQQRRLPLRHRTLLPVLILIVFILLCFYSFTVIYKHPTEKPRVPQHWKVILKHAHPLKLILLDPNGLKCFFSESKVAQRYGCAAMFSSPVIRLGSYTQDIDELIRYIKRQIIEDTLTNNRLIFFQLLPKSNPDTMVLSYTAPENYVKNIIITCLRIPFISKQYHLLRGGNITADIALRHFHSTLMQIPHHGGSIWVPNDLERFLFFLENGEFKRCNEILAAAVPKDAEFKLSPQAFKYLDEFMEIILATQQTPFLGGGTLLGWYRDCGLIPHTTDIDFYIRAEEYVDDFELAFRNKSRFRVSRRIGRKEYGLELSFWMLHYAIKDHIATPVDFFYLYDNNATTQWTPLLYDFEQLLRAKCIIPKVEKLCTADLYGYIFFIPCNYLAVLEASYGPEWYISNPKSFYFDEGTQILEDGRWTSNKDDVLILF